MILSGGTFNSPQLLQLSGIGPPALLQSLGIAVRHALPGVGENLRDHYAPRFVARVKNIETINERARGLQPVRRGAEMGDDAARHPRRSSRPWSTASGIPTRRADNSDLQLTFTPASYKEGVQGQLDDEPGMTIASWQQRPDSSGYVRARSADPFEPPIIQPNYLAEELDRRVLLAGMKLARRLLTSAAARALLRPTRISPAPRCRPTTSCWRAAKQRGTTTFHPGCTCRMGPADDPTGRGRRPAARARARGPARGRRLDHADACSRPTSTPRP